MVQLYGWDTAYATALTTLNEALATSNDLPKTLSGSWKNGNFASQIGSWEIVKGGAGTLLHIQASIASGTLQNGGTDFDLSGMKIIFEMDLTLIPESADKSNYRADLKTAGKKGDKAGDGVVTPYDIDLNGKTLGFMEKLYLMNGAAESLVAQAADFTFAFAQINLVPPNTADSWLTPHEVGYDVYGAQNGDNHLVIYAATDKRDVSKLPHQVDPELLTGSGPSYFAISRGLLTEHVLLPMMPKVFPTAKLPGTFQYSAAHQTINNIFPIPMNGVKSGAITYYPVISSVQTQITHSTIETKVSGSCDLHMGMSMTFWVTSSSKIGFDATTNKIVVTPDPHPNTGHDTHIPWYDYLMGAIPDIIIAVIVPIIGNGIADGMNSALTGMSLSKAGPQGVTWPGMTKFTPNAGLVDGGLQLSGT